MLTWTIHEKPGEPLHRTEQYGPELRIVLSQPRRYRSLRTLWAVVAGGAVLGWDVLRDPKRHDLLHAGWLVLWPLIVYVGVDLARLVWQFSGRAVFLLRPDSFVIRREIFGIGYSHTYRLSEVANLRYVLPSAWDSKKRASGFAFDYKGKEVRINDNNEEAEVNEVAREIRAWAAMVAPTAAGQL